MIRYEWYEERRKFAVQQNDQGVISIERPSGPALPSPDELPLIRKILDLADLLDFTVIK